MPASTPRACPRHGNPDRQPVRCLAFDLAHLPAIATRHRSTLAPSSLRGRLHRSRGRRPDRTADDRALPARATPAATADCPHPESLTRPRHDRSAAGTLSRLRPGPLAGDRHQAPLDAGAVVASWPASPIERTKARPNCRWSSAASTGHASGNRGLPAPREPDQATARPIGSRCAVSPSTWHHLPAIATRHRSTLAPSSPRGRLHRSRERRPDRTAGDRSTASIAPPREPDHATATPIGSRYAVSPSTWPTCRRSPPGTARHWRRRRFVAGFTDRENEGPTELPMSSAASTGHCQRQPRIARPTPTTAHGNPDRQPVRCLAFALSPLAGDRHQAPLDAGAVVASWPASPIERTKARPNCRWSSAASTGHAGGNPGARLQPMPASTPRSCPRHGNPDRQPVRCLAFALAHLPAIATRHRSTLAPSSLRGRLHRSRERRPDRTADGRALPARATPAATADCPHPESLTTPRQPRSAAGTLSRLRPGPLAGDRHQAPLDTGAVVASWPASPIERTKARPNCR
jgi:hypothetical protein